MSPRRKSDRRASPAFDHWLTLLPLFVAIVGTAALVIGS
jgi:hypothetical protein